MVLPNGTTTESEGQHEPTVNHQTPQEEDKSVDEQTTSPVSTTFAPIGATSTPIGTAKVPDEPARTSVGNTGAVTNGKVALVSEKNAEPNKELPDPLEDDDSPEIVVPPDGGWGWVVVFASFMCNLVVDGIIFSFGTFLKPIATELQVENYQVAIVQSLMAGFYLMAGPFVSAIANRYGFQLVAVAGSVAGAAVFVMSYFCTTILGLSFTYGVLGGIAFGFIYVPAVITVGFYFERWRALATGIGVCGSGIGCFVFAPMCNTLIEKLGWKNAILVQAGIVLSCAGYGILFRPVKPTKLKDIEKEKPELVMDIQKLPPATRMKMEKALDFMKAGSQASVNNNSEYPTVADVYHTISIPQHQRIVSQEKRLSVPHIPEEDKPNGSAPLLQKVDRTTPIVIANRRNNIPRRTRTASETSQTRSRSEINRPLYKDDIFFSGSLARLPQYQSKSSVAYHLSVTHLPTRKDIEEEEENRCKLCPEAVARTLATMLDVSLLKSASFNILAVSGFLTMMGFYVPFAFVSARAIDSGIDEQNAVFLISAIGIANTVGRILCGILSSLPGVNTLLVNNVALTVGGIVTMASGMSLSLEYQYTYAILFGFSISCFASLRSILVVELLGLEKLTNAFGILLLFQGVAAMLGTPIASGFQAATNSYDASFYLSGFLILLSAIICYPLNAINRWERKRHKEMEKVAKIV